MKNKINQFLNIHKNEIVDNLCKLVKIESISKKDENFVYGKNSAAALEFCLNLAKEKNLSTQNHEYICGEVMLNKVCDKKRLVIASHCDVVECDDDNIYPNFYGEVVNNYVVGRGVVDDKGPLIATLYALAFFKENNIPIKNDIRLLFGCNEENGMDDIFYYLDKVGQPDLGLAVDDDFPVVCGEKGLIRFTISSPKANCVEYIKSNGKNLRLVDDVCLAKIDEKELIYKRSSIKSNPVKEFICQLEKSPLEDKNHFEILKSILLQNSADILGISFEDEFSGKTTANLYKVDTVDNCLQFFFDVRIPVTANFDNIKEKIFCFGKQHNLSINITKESKGYFHKNDDVFVNMLTDIYNSEEGCAKKPYVMSACTYARAFTYGMGFGAGNPEEVKPFPAGHGSAHGADEAHNIDVLLNAIKMYILAIKKIDEYWG